jgi:hypothetical protein
MLPLPAAGGIGVAAECRSREVGNQENRQVIRPAYAARSGASSAFAMTIVPNFVSSDSPTSGSRGSSTSWTSVHPGPSMVTMNLGMHA